MLEELLQYLVDEGFLEIPDLIEISNNEGCKCYNCKKCICDHNRRIKRLKEIFNKFKRIIK